MKKLFIIVCLVSCVFSLNAWQLTIYDGGNPRKEILTYDVTAATKVDDIKAAVGKDLATKRKDFDPKDVHLKIRSLSHGVVGTLNDKLLQQLKPEDSQSIYVLYGDFNIMIGYDARQWPVVEKLSQRQFPLVIKDGTPGARKEVYKESMLPTSMKNYFTDSIGRIKREKRISRNICFYIVSPSLQMFQFFPKVTDLKFPFYTRRFTYDPAKKQEVLTQELLENNSKDIYIVYCAPVADELYELYKLPGEAKVPAVPSAQAYAASSIGIPAFIQESVYTQWLNAVKAEDSDLDVRIRNFILLEGACEYNKRIPAAVVSLAAVNSSASLRRTIDSVWGEIQLKIKMKSFDDLD